MYSIELSFLTAHLAVCVLNSTISGIDVTVVDSNNRTVLDLLAAHPSAKAREIESLIYGEFYSILESWCDLFVSALDSVSSGSCCTPCWDHCITLPWTGEVALVVQYLPKHSRNFGQSAIGRTILVRLTVEHFLNKWDVLKGSPKSPIKISEWIPFAVLWLVEFILGSLSKFARGFWVKS